MKSEEEKLKLRKPFGPLFPIAKQEAIARRREVTNLCHSNIL
jgi:hypothetical protein